MAVSMAAMGSTNALEPFYELYYTPLNKNPLIVLKIIRAIKRQNVAAVR